MPRTGTTERNIQSQARMGVSNRTLGDIKKTGASFPHLLHINAGFCTGLEEPDTVIFSQLSTTRLITDSQDMGNNYFLLFI